MLSRFREIARFSSCTFSSETPCRVRHSSVGTRRCIGKEWHAGANFACDR